MVEVTEELLVQQVSFINISNEFNIVTGECWNTSALLRILSFSKMFWGPRDEGG